MKRNKLNSKGLRANKTNRKATGYSLKVACLYRGSPEQRLHNLSDAQIEIANASTLHIDSPFIVIADGRRYPAVAAKIAGRI